MLSWNTTFIANFRRLRNRWLATMRVKMRNFPNQSKSSRCTPLMDAVRFARPPPALPHQICSNCRNASITRAVHRAYRRLKSMNDIRPSKNSTSQSPSAAFPNALTAHHLTGIGAGI